MSERRSSRTARELKKLPAHRQAVMLRAIAAAEGISDEEMVKLALEVNNPNPRQPRKSKLGGPTKFWAPKFVVES